MMGHSAIRELAELNKVRVDGQAAARNGWGFIVVEPNGRGLYASGSIPRWFLEAIPAKKTYIFLI